MILTDLECGKQARVVHFTQTNHELEQRLMHLNILQGTILTMKRALSLGGPIVVSTNGQHIGIRRKDAQCIAVECV